MRWNETHCHSREFSLDAKRPLAELLLEADRKNFGAICLTDHYDKDGVSGQLERYVSAYGEQPAEGEWIFPLEEYFAELLSLKQKRSLTPEKTQVLIGVELGYADYLVPFYQNLLQNWPFDQVIASIHFMDGVDLYFNREFYEQNKAEAYRAWMMQLLQLAQSDLRFNVLGHFDYVVRYAKYKDVQLYYDDFPDEFDALFKAMAERDIALEINTRFRYSKLNSGLPDPGFMDERIIKRYLDLGGELVSLSSDSHENGTVGRLFEESAKLLHKNGVKRISWFNERKPQFLYLD